MSTRFQNKVTSIPPDLSLLRATFSCQCIVDGTSSHDKPDELKPHKTYVCKCMRVHTRVFISVYMYQYVCIYVTYSESYINIRFCILTHYTQL